MFNVEIIRDGVKYSLRKKPFNKMMVIESVEIDEGVWITADDYEVDNSIQTKEQLESFIKYQETYMED